MIPPHSSSTFPVARTAVRSRYCSSFGSADWPNLPYGGHHPASNAHSHISGLQQSAPERQPIWLHPDITRFCLRSIASVPLACRTTYTSQLCGGLSARSTHRRASLPRLGSSRDSFAIGSVFTHRETQLSCDRFVYLTVSLVVETATLPSSNTYQFGVMPSRPMVATTTIQAGSGNFSNRASSSGFSNLLATLGSLSTP